MSTPPVSDAAAANRSPGDQSGSAPGPRGRAPVRLLSDVPTITPQPAPPPPPLDLKTASEDAILARIARLIERGARAPAEEAAWVLVQRANPGLRLGRRPRSPAERAVRDLFLARALLADRNHREAAEAARRALAADPGLADAHMLLCAALREGGAWEEAIPAARAALTVKPDMAPTLAVLLDSLLDLGRTREAEVEACRALAAHPAHPEMVRVAAGALARRGQIDQAVTALARAADHPRVKGDPRAADLVARAGQALTTQGRHAEALPLYQAAVRRSPRLAPAQDGVIACLHALGREGEALEVRRRADRLIPGFTAERLDFAFPLLLPPLARPPGGDAPPHQGDGPPDDGRPDDGLSGPLDLDRALLVNGIGVLPALPLGIAAIKGSVEAVSTFTCTLVDLNAKHFRSVISALRQGQTAFDFEGSAEMDAAFALMEQADPRFADPATFKELSPHIALGLSLTERTIEAQLARAAGRQGPVPWMVAAYARHLLTARAGVIGFSITFTDQLTFSTQCARIIKALRPDLRILFGGGFFKDSNLEGFVAEPFVDAVILDEGEEPFHAALEATRAGRPLTEVAGAVVHHPEDDRITRVPVAPAPRAVPRPPPRFDDTDPADYLAPVPVYPVLTSRGCYWRRCTFCNHFASYANTYKATPIAAVVDELEHHIRSGVRHFTFVDEMISAARFRKISEEILARGLDLRFYALAKPTGDFTAETLALMRKAGCLCIYWGLESGSDRVLRLMDKGNDADGSARTLALAREAGIRNHVFLIVGFPGETPADLRETVDFVHRHHNSIDATVAGSFVLETGTPVHDHHHRFGIRRIYPKRSLCDGVLIDYEIEGALSQARAARYAAILRQAFFDSLSAYGPFLGTPRDHVVALYDLCPGDAAPPPRRIAHPDAVWPMLDDPSVAAPEGPAFRIVPVWRPERAAGGGGGAAGEAGVGTDPAVSGSA